LLIEAAASEPQHVALDDVLRVLVVLARNANPSV
jgi:hypothetical protein